QKKFTVPPGFEVRLFASEPDVINPVAMTWDERGRLWVVELYEYPEGAPAGTKGRDRIKILEDTDNDGRADKVTVFADGLNLATGILIGNGGAYVGQAPDLLFLQDTNHDDVADTRKVLMTGFGLHDRHELLNGFTWGPDGWLYMTHGVFTHSKVKIPEATEPGIEMNAAVARFHPVTKKFEIYADGTSNPWGVDFDKYGNAFVSACVIDHLFHMAPGGIYERQGGVPGNPYAYELLPSIVKHTHHRAAYCGICIYQGDNFPEEYRGRVFMGNIHQNAINHDRLIPNGSSFNAVAEKDFLTTTDGWFRPVSEQVGPDGALWIADWYDKYPCYQNAKADPEGVDRERGRIWRAVYTGKDAGKKMGSRPDAKMDLAKLSDAELIKVLKHSNVWQRRVAQRLLTERVRQNKLNDAGNGMDSLLNLMDSGTNSIETRIAAFWVLAESNREREAYPKWVFYGTLFGGNSDDRQLVHSWMGAKFFGETRDSSASTLEALEQLASNPDPRIRLAVATACRQLVSSSLTIDTDINTDVPVGKVLAALIKSSSDAKDPLIPFMIWMASEPLVAKNPEPGLRWLAQNGADTMPLSGILARKTLRRICDTGDAAKMDAAVEFLSAVADKNSALTLAALDGLLEGQRAKPILPVGDTKAVLTKLNESSNADVKQRAQQLGALWGDATAVRATIAKISQQQLSATERIQAIQTAKQAKTQDLLNALIVALKSDPDPTVRQEALRAFVVFSDYDLPKLALEHWREFSVQTRKIGVEVMASRSTWAKALLDAVAKGTVSRNDFSASVIRTLHQSRDEAVSDEADVVLGKFRETTADKLKLIKEKRRDVLNGEPNIERGHELAKKTCFVCHKYYNEGADVGPDLTGVGRSTLEALLANVIDPNQVIGKGYENVMVETKDGRSISGRMVENSDSQIKLLATGPVETVLAKSDIASMKVSELSVMPEGLEQMPDEDFRDMIWFILSPPQEGALTPEKRNALLGK
ncbi:MAG: PVC-type heme-binding CxxCH protein, partial [Verrucomicrobiota bacterium]